MAKKQKKFVCQECGATFSKWYGQCPNCGAWNSLVEVEAESAKGSKTSLRSLPLNEVKVNDVHRLTTGIKEADRVLGGGLVPGSLILLAGEPGIGKSTLASQIGLNLATKYPVYYLSGEENLPQIKLRLQRLTSSLPTKFYLIEGREISGLENLVIKEKPSLIIIDSIQTVESGVLESQIGSISQIRQIAQQLMDLAKRYLVPIIIIGHITKEGRIAGPKLLEHMVDTVIYFEGDSNHQFRILRAVKNRFGTTNEVGLFTMEGSGLKEVANPLTLFSSQLKVAVPGAATGVIMEGDRPILVEVQALVNPTVLNIPRRVAQGISTNKLVILSAIISRRLGLPLGNYDVFVNITGGLRVQEPAIDLAVSLAIVSAVKQKPLKPKSAFFGEVGLLGEVRPVPFVNQRLKEAKRLGMERVGVTQPTLLRKLAKSELGT